MTTGESIALEIQFDLMVELLPRVKLGSQSKNLEALSVVGTQVQNSCSSDQQKFYAMQILDQKELNMKQKHRWNENALRFGALVMTIGLESFLKQILEELRLEGTKAGNIKNGGC
ncbi:hypothetical protein Tco_1466341 [Tanacetum coccineum]